LGRIEKSIIIKASPEKVWEMLAVDRWSEWMEEYKSSKYTSEVNTPEDKYRVGVSAHIIEKDEFLGKPVEFDLEITESLENEKIIAHSKGKMIMTLTYILKSVEEGSELAFVWDYETPWGILGKFLDRLFGEKHVEKHTEKSLEKLKSILEKK